MKDCQFCQKETTYLPLTHAGRHFDVHYCFGCRTQYVKWAHINNVHLYTLINDRMYRWSIEMDGRLGRLWYIAEPGTPGKIADKGVELIKNFGAAYPTINPSNIQEKLKFILTFL